MASFATASSATVVSHTRPSMESDYVFVRRNGRSAPYQVQAVFDNASPASSRSASPMPGVGTSVTQTSQSQGSSTPAVTRKRKWSRNEKWIDANGGATPGQVPRDVLFSGTSGSAFTSSASGSGSKQTRSSAKGKDTGSATSSHLPHPTQPLLLRPRAGPESEPTDSDINFTSVMGDSDSISLFTVSQPQPLSPTSSTFNMSLLTVDPFLPSSSSKALSDREKRRKLAKLARTLGENIPPELVFRSNTSNNSSSSSSPRRRASLSIKPYSNSGLSTTTSKAPTLPPLAVAEMPLPTLSSESVPQPLPKRASNLLARARPRSLALGSTSAFVAANNALSSKTHRNVVEAARGTTSLDVQRQSPAPRGVQLLPLGVSTKPCYPPSPRPFVNAVAPQSRSSSSSSSSDTSDDDESDNDAKNGVSLEWGRRKEREWSGEWNLRDMEDVAMKLRCLKGR